MMSDYKRIEFDLSLNDYRKALVLVKDLLFENIKAVENNNNNNVFEKELDGSLGLHVHCKFDKQNTEANDCKFCEFTNLLADNFSKVEISKDLTASRAKNEIIYLKYKTGDYDQSQLDWCEFQPRRSPYSLFGYASCSSQLELLNAIKKFNSFKDLYKKTLIQSKLFIFLKKNFVFGRSERSNSELITPEFRSRQNSINSSRFSLNENCDSSLANSDAISVHTNLDEDEIISSNKLIVANNYTESILRDENADFSSTDNFDSLQNIQQIDLSKRAVFTLGNQDEAKTSNNADIDVSQVEMDLNSELKNLEGNVIYLDATANQQASTIRGFKFEAQDITKIKLAVNDLSIQIYMKLSKLAAVVDPKDETKINYYSELLKTPVERDNLSNKDQNSSQLTMQLKFVKNNKKIGGRMNKYRGDLLLAVNSVEKAFYYYFKAYNTLKAENDPIWCYDALLGMCATSCFYLKDNSATIRMMSSPSNLNMVEDEEMTELSNKEKTLTKKPSKIKIFDGIKKKLMTPEKDLKNFIIAEAGLYKAFQNILKVYRNSPDYSFMELELCIMIAKYFIERSLPRPEIFHFINDSIYISKLSLSEESRMRRYLEVSGLYAQLKMNRISSFYKWISCRRIFNLLNLSLSYQGSSSNVSLKRILLICLAHLLSIFENYNIAPTQTPAKLYSLSFGQGFSLTKKRIISEIVQLYNVYGLNKEAFIYGRYLLHELFAFMSPDELSNITKFLLGTQNDFCYRFDDHFYSQYYNLPQLSAFKINITTDSTISKLPKSIENFTAQKSLYIYRYDPLATGKKKLSFTILKDEKFSIDLTLKNPLAIPIQVEKIALLLECEQFEETIKLKSFQSKLSVINFEPFEVPEKAKDFIKTIEIVANEIGKFKIIGYLINSFNGVSKILFSDIIKITPQTKKRGLNTNIQSIIGEYEVEVIHRLPKLQRIFLRSKHSEQRELYDLLNENSNKIFTYVGQRKVFDLVIERDESINEDLEIIDVNFRIISYDDPSEFFEAQLLKEESQLGYYQIEIKSRPNGKYDKLVQSYNCSVEVKFTNKLCKELYYVRTIKKTLIVEYHQPISVKTVAIKNYNEKMFLMDFKVENSSELAFDCEFLSDNEFRRIKLQPNADVNLSAKLEKIEFNLLQHTNFELNDKLFSKLINERLKFKSNFDSNEIFQVEFQFQYSNDYNNIAFKKPFNILFVENKLYNDLLIQNLMGIQFTCDFGEKQGSFFQIRLLNKKNLCVINSDVFEKIKKFKTNEIKLIQTQSYKKDNDHDGYSAYRFYLVVNDSLKFEWTNL